jgi:hypothetical protein
MEFRRGLKLGSKGYGWSWPAKVRVRTGETPAPPVGEDKPEGFISGRLRPGRR